MNVTILKDGVRAGNTTYKRGQVVDAHPVIAKSWIEQDVAVSGAEEVEAEEIEDDDDQGVDYEVEAEAHGAVDTSQSVEERAAELMEDHTVAELKEIHESLVGKKPHWKAKEEAIALAIAEAERA